MTLSETEKTKQEAIQTPLKVRITDRLAVYFVCLVILCFGIVFLILPKKDFSESENRTLAAFPSFTFENIKSGNFTKTLNTYAADHFPLRNGFLTVITETERISGRRDINKVYLAKDGSLIEEYNGGENVEKQYTQFGKLAENTENADCYLMLVPTAVTVYSNLLPKYSPDADKLSSSNADSASVDQNKQIKNNNPDQLSVIRQIYSSVPDKLHTVDVSDHLLAAADSSKQGNNSNTASETDKSNQKLFYRTDHHWTTYGAYIGYLAFCKEAGLTPVPLDEYDENVVSTNFKGTIYSKLNDPYFGSDTIVSYSHPDWKLAVQYSDLDETFDTPYNPEYLSEKDQYSYFLNNIHPMATITNDAVPDGAIAVVKDSYANSMIPFLLNHYHTVYVFDTRYYKGGVSKFINEHPEISDVLILYNMNTIDSDNGIGGIY